MRRPLLATALAALALPAVAQAHTASVVCNPAGGYIGIADYEQFHPSFTITPPTATVRWDDGFRLVVPLPTGCVVVPETPAAPPVVETPPVEPAFEGTPSVAAPPVVTTPGAVEPQPHKRVTRAAPRYRCPKGELPSFAWQRIIHRRHGVWCAVKTPQRKVTRVKVAG